MKGDDFSRGQSKALSRLLTLICISRFNKDQGKVLLKYLEDDVLADIREHESEETVAGAESVLNLIIGTLKDQ